MSLQERIAQIVPDVVRTRHDLHAHPELAYEEKRTSEVVIRELKALGIEVISGLAGGTGVLGKLPATGTAKRSIGLRADMDALPITEETGKPYASQNAGVMHACGHDAHTSMLLGTARILSQTEYRPNDITFVFQPAEERGAGGAKMVEDGALEGLDSIFGLHGWPNMPLGTRITRVGAMMGSADVMKVRIYGKGGHAAFPHLTVDPIVIGAQIVTALQTVTSRNVDPLMASVLSVTKFEAGTASNIIPEYADILGTLRTLNDDVRAMAMRRIEEIIHGTCSAMGARAEIEFYDSYPVTVNHQEAVQWFREAVEGASQEDLVPVMGAEDFSYYGKHIPACFFMLGLLPEGQETYPGLHTPQFDFNDEAIPYGIEAFCQIALHE